jgi:5-methylcytosine-specific restriction protein B
VRWSDITERDAALKAIAEFDDLGREAFLSKYGFGRSTYIFVRHNGNLYDSKALAGVTRGFADPSAGPLKNNEFTGGRAIVDLFGRLGFEVVRQGASDALNQAAVLREAIEVLLSGYIAAKGATLGKDSAMWIAMNQAEAALRELTWEYPNTIVKSSVGKGNWAEVPWIALLDQRLTDTTRRGVYVVYLFRGDMSGVYLTFNQGVTQLKNELGWPTARARLSSTAGELRQRYAVRLRPAFTSADGIDLRPKKGGLGAEYEASTIAWRLYEVGAVPAPNALLEDLYAVLDAYEDYASDPEGATEVTSPSKEAPMQSTSQLHAALYARGYNFEPWQIAAFVTCLRTKPFVILAGISGTGKSKLPALVGELTGAHVDLIPVRPDWTDSADLLGYTNLQGSFVPGRLLTIARDAQDHPERKHFAILDEMNLARVEQYFAEVLSLIEDRTSGEHGFASHGPLLPSAPSPWDEVRLPPNLAIIGTVNMDETTHGFSRKVLDRAFTLEMSDVDLASWRQSIPGPTAQLQPWTPEQWRPRGLRPAELPALSDAELAHVENVISTLKEVNQILSLAQLQVGYRIRDEIAMFLLHADDDLAAYTSGISAVTPLDLALHMKILPRLQGGSSAIRLVLRRLIAWAHDSGNGSDEDDIKAVVDAWVGAGRPAALGTSRFPRTSARLCLMWERLQAEGFTSYWL